MGELVLARLVQARRAWGWARLGWLAQAQVGQIAKFWPRILEGFGLEMCEIGSSWLVVAYTGVHLPSLRFQD